jgi:hypothetical protein
LLYFQIFHLRCFKILPYKVVMPCRGERERREVNGARGRVVTAAAKAPGSGHSPVATPPPSPILSFSRYPFRPRSENCSPPQRGQILWCSLNLLSLSSNGHGLPPSSPLAPSLPKTPPFLGSCLSVQGEEQTSNGGKGGGSSADASGRRAPAQRLLRPRLRCVLLPRK